MIVAESLTQQAIQRSSNDDQLFKINSKLLVRVQSGELKAPGIRGLRRFLHHLSAPNHWAARGAGITRDARVMPGYACPAWAPAAGLCEVFPCSLNFGAWRC